MRPYIKAIKIMKINMHSIVALLGVGLMSMALTTYAGDMTKTDGMMEQKTMEKKVMAEEKMDDQMMDGKMSDKKMMDKKEMGDKMKKEM